jgi:hypothetical protein
LVDESQQFPAGVRRFLEKFAHTGEKRILIASAARQGIEPLFSVARTPVMPRLLDNWFGQ